MPQGFSILARFLSRLLTVESLLSLRVQTQLIQARLLIVLVFIDSWLCPFAGKSYSTCSYFYNVFAQAEFFYLERFWKRVRSHARHHLLRVIEGAYLFSLVRALTYRFTIANVDDRSQKTVEKVHVI